MDSKHTPGPWQFDEDAVFTSFDMDGDIVCFMPNPDEYEASAAKWPANRYLIAAAPDLLEACKVASAMLKGLPRSLGYDFDAKQLDAAIAKAEGR